jgi:hypothetical protein
MMVVMSVSCALSSTAKGRSDSQDRAAAARRGGHRRRHRCATRAGMPGLGLQILGGLAARQAHRKHRPLPWFEEMKGSSGNVRRTVSDRHLPFQSSRSRQSYRVVGGGADPVDGPLRPTARLSAIGTFAGSTRARQANRFAERPEFCDQYARDRGSAETVPSSIRRALPGRKLQFTNPRRTVSDRHLPFQSSRSRQSYRVVGGGADPVDGPLRPTARLSAIGTFAGSTRATGARLKLCQAQAVGRFPAESYSLPILSFPLQPLRPHNARTRARTAVSCRSASMC